MIQNKKTGGRLDIWGVSAIVIPRRNAKRFPTPVLQSTLSISTRSSCVHNGYFSEGFTLSSGKAFTILSPASDKQISEDSGFNSMSHRLHCCAAVLGNLATILFSIRVWGFQGPAVELLRGSYSCLTGDST